MRELSELHVTGHVSALAEGRRIYWHYEVHGWTTDCGITKVDGLLLSRSLLDRRNF